MTLPIAGSLTMGSHMASENFEILIIKYPAASYCIIHLAVLYSPVYKIPKYVYFLQPCSLLMHVLLGSDMITGWLIATVYHFALVSGR